MFRPVRHVWCWFWAGWLGGCNLWKLRKLWGWGDDDCAAVLRLRVAGFVTVFACINAFVDQFLFNRRICDIFHFFQLEYLIWAKTCVWHIAICFVLYLTGER